MISNIRLASAALGLIMALPAFAVHEPLSVVEGACIAASEPNGCTFNGNISEHNHLDVQALYNGLDPARYDAPVRLRYLASTDHGGLAALGGSITGADTTSGTWPLPGYNVDFMAVKEASHFTLYKFASDLSSGSWNTFDTAFLHNDMPQEMSPLVFFGAAVPESESWAMLIAGFGLVGAVMWRRRALITTFA